LTVARDFDLGMTGPPLTISMDFIAGGMAEMVGGIACALILLRYAWWAPILLAGAWAATHWLLRESAVWRDRNTEEVRSAQRDARENQPRRSRGLHAECHRRFDDRFRRIQLGARRSGCAGRGRAAA